MYSFNSNSNSNSNSSSESDNDSESESELTVFNIINDLENEIQERDTEEYYLIDGFELINNENNITNIYRNLNESSFNDTEIFGDTYIDISRIYEKDYLFLDSEKINNKYYIGVYNIINKELVLSSCISPSTFFEFPINAVQAYLSSYSIFYRDCTFIKTVNILKLCINETDGTYNVIIKTSWLRFFQRKWKKIFAEKRSIMEHKKKLSNIRYFELYGKWPPK